MSKHQTLAAILGVVLALPGGATAQSPLTTPPAPTASESIIEISLQDPVNAQSRTYLDLESGKTFTYGESTPQDLLELHRWLTSSGADLMCESRQPAQGFVAYDMALIETTGGIDQPRQYAQVVKQLDGVAPESFQIFSALTRLPRTYLFRTREETVGVLEIVGTTEQPSGLRLRYRFIPKLTQVERERLAAKQQEQAQQLLKFQQQGPRAAAIAAAQRRMQVPTAAERIQLIQTQIQVARDAGQGAHSPTVSVLARSQEVFQLIADIQPTGNETRLEALKRAGEQTRAESNTLRLKQPGNRVALLQLQQRWNLLQDEIYTEEVAAGNGAIDPVQAFLARQINVYQGQLAQMRRVLGDKHPVINALKGQIAAMERQAKIIQASATQPSTEPANEENLQ